MLWHLQPHRPSHNCKGIAFPPQIAIKERMVHDDEGIGETEDNDDKEEVDHHV